MFLKFRRNTGYLGVPVNNNSYRDTDFLNDIFKRAIEGPKIFKNKAVLFHDYIPHSLPFREEEIKKIAHLLSNLLKGYRSSNLFVYGKPGTGKTAVVKYVINRFISILEEYNKDLNYSYVNCRLAGTEYRIITNIAKDISLDLPFTGLSSEEALNRVINKIISDNKPLLIVLDEIDSLINRYGDKLLYTLTRFTSEKNNGSFSIPYMIIGISNNLTFKEYMDPRVLSSLSEDELVFKPYTPNELETIISERVPLAFFPNVVEDEAIKLAAALSGAEHGDARKALDLIRVAGEIAEIDNDIKVKSDHVKKAYSNIDKERIVDTVSSLPLHSRIILATLLYMTDSGYDVVKSSILYNKYTDLSKKVAGSPLSYRRFLGLITELGILGLVNKRLANYGRRGGRVSLVKLSVPLKLIKKSLESDPIISGLFS
jgi:cell division control protein 6